MSIQTPPQAEEVYYPSGDGEPMAETPLHVLAILFLLQALEDVFEGKDVHIAADQFWYWEEGNPAARRAPDLMVVLDVPRKYRRSFFSWRDNGRVPNVIFEMASENTWREDLYEKRPLYASLGVREYFMFDPEALYLRPQLQGFRLQNGSYVPLEADTEDRLFSAELNLFLGVDGEMIRLFHGESRQPIPTRKELAEKAQEQLHQQRKRAEQEKQRAEQEKQRAEQEKQRAEQEKQRADALEAELARLRALFDQQSPKQPDPPPPT